MLTDDWSVTTAVSQMTFALAIHEVAECLEPPRREAASEAGLRGFLAKSGGRDADRRAHCWSVLPSSFACPTFSMVLTHAAAASAPFTMKCAKKNRR